jgi:Ca-activated chloride channel family protein
LVVALARPVVHYKPTSQDIAISSVVMALDISYSMRAKDIKPSRLQASKAIIKEFLTINPRDQVALIGFTTNALMLSPLTQDHRVVNMALDSLNQKHIITKGTNLKKLIQKVALFPKEVKVVVILSDGGDEPIDSEVITMAQEHNIKIIAVAMATTQGASIENEEGVLRDKKGNIVISRLNPALRELAVATGGEYIPYSYNVATQINEYIQNLNQDKIIASQSIQSYYDLYYILVFIALVLLLHAYTTIHLKVVALLALMGINLNAGVIDNYYLSKASHYFEEGEYNQSIKTLQSIDELSMQSLMLQANNYYKLEQYKRAKALYRQIKTTNPTLKHQLYHNLGNCEAKLNYYDRAKNYYIKALQLMESNETMHNLEIVMHLKAKYNAKIGVTNPRGGMSKSSGDKENSDEKKGRGGVK